MTGLMRLDDLFPSRDQFFRPLEEIFNKTYDELFSDRNTLGNLVKQGGYPRLDVLAKDGKWLVEVACPGCRTEDVEVRIVPDQRSGTRFVKITGRMNDAYEHTDASYYVKQLSRTSFEKVVRLPDNVKGEPDAVLNDGILKLAWDLPTELDESKVIRVKSLDSPALENKKAK